MILDAITKSLEIVLAGAVTANQLQVVSAWADITSTTFTPGETDTQSNNTTAVTIVAAPAASTQRQIKEVIVYNKDTASATVIIQYNSNSTIRILVRITLLTLETLVYREGIGWMVLDTNGAIKTLISLFSHHLTHESGGSDAIKADDLAALDDNTDLNASNAVHGFLPKLGAANSKAFVNAAGTVLEFAKGLYLGGLTRNGEAASENVAYTGVGFKPEMIFFVAVIDNTTKTSIGFSNKLLNCSIVLKPDNTWGYAASHCIFLWTDSGNWQAAYIASMDSDGFTLTWIKTGGGSVGTITVYYMAFR